MVNSNSETVEVISALELVYQLMRRYYTGCTEWDDVTAHELRTEIRNRIAAADAALGNSAEANDSDSENMKAYQSAVHWDDAYKRLLCEVLGLVKRSSKDSFIELHPLQTYTNTDLNHPDQVFIFYPSAVRWAKRHHKIKLPADVVKLRAPLPQDSVTNLQPYSEGESTCRSLAELTRQLLLHADPDWQPGLSDSKRVSRKYYRAGKLNVSALAQDVAAELPPHPEGKDPLKAIRNNFTQIEPLVEGKSDQATAISKEALPGFYRTNYGLTLLLEKKIGPLRSGSTEAHWPPETVIGNLTQGALIDATSLKETLASAKDKRLK